MSTGLTYLITGANRGIGLTLTQFLLKRPDTKVIACVRNIDHLTTQDLKNSPHHPGSLLLIHELDSTSDIGPFSLIDTLINTHGIHHLDVVIANAGSATKYAPVIDTPLSALRSDYEINTLGPLKLFQASYKLLAKSQSTSGILGKFIVVSSVIGSIEFQSMEMGTVLSYGMSKAGVNFLVKRIHVEHDDVVAVALHPGWVKTLMGQGYADLVGVESAPTELDECVTGMLKQIDWATKDTMSGSFIRTDSQIIPW